MMVMWMNCASVTSTLRKEERGDGCMEEEEEREGGREKERGERGKGVLRVVLSAM